MTREVNFDLAAAVEKSTKKSGVPLKVRDATKIAQLALLVKQARQPRPNRG